ncbi:DMT family transporter [Mesorhizobium sp. BAC0120]|uniref:DMT family transporter n=1 Tax=Mesorhizobium sp. BAC0120 TaxID=3090670 RepID=UPI00298D3AB3|nr:DMT family transporter [Mesorhizobium sp. BAC0120]MDW6022340.1 DMT family transporter [Mesorhizobium sp. BAC0120]
MSSALGSNKLLASVLGAIGVVLWATETTLITFTTALPPLQTVALAFMFAACLTPFVCWTTGTHPLAAFRQPVLVWVVTVTALVGYHACIYYATQKAPPMAAALLQGTTPLMIVLGSALLPGERLRWWHVAGALVGLCGVLLLVEQGGEAARSDGHAVFYLSLIGVAAALWGLYSLLSRSFADVPSSVMGTFYAASAILAGLAHLLLEQWVQPSAQEWLAIALLGMLPMGLAIFLWDYGMKKGDIQALGAFSYVEPFIGALLVALLAGAALQLSLLWSGCLVVGGAVLAGRSLWEKSTEHAVATKRPSVPEELARAHNYLISRMLDVHRAGIQSPGAIVELTKLLSDLELVMRLWDEWDGRCQPSATSLGQPSSRAA